MKKISIMIALLTGFVFSGVEARPGGHFFKHSSLNSDMDINGDGIVTREELETYKAAEFSAADSDGSGYLDLTELETYQDAKQTEQVDNQFSALDTDSSSTVSQAELVNGMTKFSEADVTALFLFADGSADGELTLEEFSILFTEDGKALKNFLRLDSDDDNQISEGEFSFLRK